MDLHEVKVDPVNETPAPGSNSDNSEGKSPQVVLEPLGDNFTFDPDAAADALKKHATVVQTTIAGRNFQAVSQHGKRVKGQPQDGENGTEHTDGRGLFDTAARVSGFDTTSGEHIFGNKVIKASIEWTGLTYSVVVGTKKNKTTKTILSNLSGHVKYGHLLAVMGPTGCGKTSLINALAGRLPAGGRLDGTILVNGQPRAKNFKVFSAYVMQDDVLLHNLTVKETFIIAAKLRLPPSMGKEAKLQVVDDIITELGLAKAANTQIGNNFMRGVSGGERKRCNIGVELMANPSIIFLDEPTSGLDAFQAQNVMESLWNLAHHGRTVISTIHQPRSSIYNMFDYLLLMSEGMVMYNGPASNAVEYFSKWGFSCPGKYNPADFFLDVVSMDYRSAINEQACRERVQLLASVYRHEADSHTLPVSVSEKSLQGVEGKFSFATNWFQQFGILMRRAWLQGTRDKLPVRITLIQSIFIAIVLGILYTNLKKDQKGIQDTIGILFFIAIFTAFGNMLQVINTFPAEKAIVNRERASKSYRVSSYFLSKVIAETPLRLLAALIFSSIVYWMAHLNPGAKQFFRFFALMVLEALAAQGLGICISASCRNEKVAMALAPAVTIILILFGGFYVNTDTIPKWIRWVQYLSHLYWVFMGLSINEFRGACCWSTAGGGSETGEQVLNTLGFGSWPMYAPFLGLAGLMVAYNFLGYVALRYKKPRFMPLVGKVKKGK